MFQTTNQLVYFPLPCLITRGFTGTQLHLGGCAVPPGKHAQQRQDAPGVHKQPRPKAVRVLNCCYMLLLSTSFQSMAFAQ